jgi:hypothetical protein
MSMKRVVRPVLSLLVSVAATLLLSVVFTAPASAAQYLASVPTADFTTYCQAHGYSDARLVAENAYGWRCVSADGRQDTFSVTAVCREVTVQDDEPTIVDFLYDFTRTDNYAWECYRLSQVAALGRLDVDGYCRSQGYDRGALVSGSTALSWQCQSPTYSFDLNSVDILSNACAAVYPTTLGTVRARVVDFFDPHAIDCMV